MNLFCEKWNAVRPGEALREDKPDDGPHEANFLKLDSTKIKETFGWQSKWSIKDTMERIVDWTVHYFAGDDVNAVMEAQIRDYTQKK